MDIKDFSVFPMQWGVKPAQPQELIDLALHAEELGLAFLLESIRPGIDLGTLVHSRHGYANLSRCGRCIGPDANSDGKVTADRGRIQLDLNDFRIPVDVVMGIEGGIETESGSQR